jgi:hypothetical protein
MQRLGRVAPRGANVCLKVARREATAPSGLSLFFAASKFDCFAEPVIGRTFSLRVSVACNDGLRIRGRGCLKSESEIHAAGRSPPRALGRLLESADVAVAVRAMTSALLSPVFA